jgi:ATP-binding cassette subfamily B protein
VNLLPRFHEYTGGRVLLDGVELKDYSRSYLRKQIGIVEQEPFLFSRSIRENIMYGVGRDVPQEEVERAAKAAAVHDVILTFPDGYNTLVGKGHPSPRTKRRGHCAHAVEESAHFDP